VDIFKGWEDEMKKEGFIPLFWENTTFTSIGKISRIHDFVIIDEPHEMSVNQQIKLAEKLEKYKGPILGLTGTLTNKTKNELYDNLNLDTCYTYPISQGVEEGILVDYQMFIHQVELDNIDKAWGAKKNHTEKKWFDMTDFIRKDSDNPKTKHMMNLRLINILQNSLAKRLKTMRLIHEYRRERILVFCGVTEVADGLQIPVYHSKAREKRIFEDFCSGTGMHLATIKMMQAGITVTPINKGIINYMSGNPEDSAQKICRFLGLEYNNPDKKAEIHIVSTNEDFELSRLRTGLSFFDPAKIIFKT
jgi:superfamily II DNA or RNA helicase